MPDLESANFLSIKFLGSNIKKIEPIDGGLQLQSNITIKKAKQYTTQDIQKRKYSKKKSLIHTFDALIEKIGNVIPISWEKSKYAKTIDVDLGSDTLDNWDDVKLLLSESYKKQYTLKEDNELFNLSSFDFSKTEEGTIKGKANHKGSAALFFDFDKTDILPEQLNEIITVKHLIFNSYSNMKSNKMSYRLMIPLSNSVDSSIYQELWDYYSNIIIEYSKDKMNYGNKLEHGLDRASRTITQFYYLPAKAWKKEHSFWNEKGWYNKLLNVKLFLENMKDEEIEEIVIIPTIKSDYLNNYQINQIEKAENIYANSLIGEGNKQFFLLGYKIYKITGDKYYTENVLRKCVNYSRHNSERTKQIPSILNYLK